MAQKFKITYATMSADNEELQSAFDQALASVEANLGVEVPMFIDGERVYSSEKMNSYSPIDTDMLLCVAQKGTRQFWPGALHLPARREGGPVVI